MASLIVLIMQLLKLYKLNTISHQIWKDIYQTTKFYKFYYNQQSFKIQIVTHVQGCRRQENLFRLSSRLASFFDTIDSVSVEYQTKQNKYQIQYVKNTVHCTAYQKLLLELVYRVAWQQSNKKDFIKAIYGEHSGQVVENTANIVVENTSLQQKYT